MNKKILTLFIPIIFAPLLFTIKTQPIPITPSSSLQNISKNQQFLAKDPNYFVQNDFLNIPTDPTTSKSYSYIRESGVLKDAKNNQYAIAMYGGHNSSNPDLPFVEYLGIYQYNGTDKLNPWENIKVFNLNTITANIKLPLTSFEFQDVKFDFLHQLIYVAVEASPIDANYTPTDAYEGLGTFVYSLSNSNLTYFNLKSNIHNTHEIKNFEPENRSGFINNINDPTQILFYARYSDDIMSTNNHVIKNEVWNFNTYLSTFLQNKFAANVISQSLFALPNDKPTAGADRYLNMLNIRSAQVFANKIYFQNKTTINAFSITNKTLNKNLVTGNLLRDISDTPQNKNGVYYQTNPQINSASPTDNNLKLINYKFPTDVNAIDHLGNIFLIAETGLLIYNFQNLAKQIFTPIVYKTPPHEIIQNLNTIQLADNGQFHITVASTKVINNLTEEVFYNLQAYYNPAITITSPTKPSTSYLSFINQNITQNTFDAYANAKSQIKISADNNIQQIRNNKNQKKTTDKNGNWTSDPINLNGTATYLITYLDGSTLNVNAIVKNSINTKIKVEKAVNNDGIFTSNGKFDVLGTNNNPVVYLAEKNGYQALNIDLTKLDDNSNPAFNTLTNLNLAACFITNSTGKKINLNSTGATNFSTLKTPYFSSLINNGTTKKQTEYGGKFTLYLEDNLDNITKINFQLGGQVIANATITNSLQISQPSKLKSWYAITGMTVGLMILMIPITLIWIKINKKINYRKARDCV